MFNIAEIIREKTFIEHCPTCDTRLVPEGDNTLKCPAHLRVWVLCAKCYRLATDGSPDQKHCRACHSVIMLCLLFETRNELFAITLQKEKEASFKAGRAEALQEAKERLDAMADDYSLQADKALDSYGPAPYYTCLDKANALREGANAIEALG